MARAGILAVVAKQFLAVAKRLDKQLAHTARIQRQLDLQRHDIADLRRTVERANRSLKELAAKP